MMDKVTLKQVNAAIKKHIQADDMVIAMVTADGEAMKEALVSDKPSPMDYGEVEKPGEILEEDKEIERYPLAILAANVAVVPVDEMFLRRNMLPRDVAQRPQD